MKVLSITGNRGIAELGGMKREIGLHLLPDIEVGNYVIVHAGFAIQRLDEELAKVMLDNLKGI